MTPSGDPARRTARVAAGDTEAWSEVAPRGTRPVSTASRRQVVLVVYDGAELVDIGSVTSALHLATRLGADPGYQVRVATVDGTDIVSAGGLVLRVDAALTEVEEPPDTVIVSGGWGHLDAIRDRRLVREVRRLASVARRVVSVCTGAFVLAEAGLLDHRRVATHWYYADDLAARYPAVRVDADPVYIQDGRIATSGGVTASLDLTLALIEDDHGPELARWVAIGMVTYLHRPGNQAQMSIFTATRRPDDTVLRTVVDHIVAEPGGDLSVATLAARVNVSPRHLTRLFRDRQGETPAAVVRRIRLEIAARLLATTELSLAVIARRCGFSSVETLRQAFVAKYELSPRAFRRTIGSTVPPPDQGSHPDRDHEAADAEPDRELQAGPRKR
ncbi:GlxA family transcriptional regulator [Microlunatus speluncae]|uniref:GlxA family transcriptional regulator n=1 Tax=Microlunatus speluncae TaxID=2594267 RepID=UPI0012664014|nr:DJ-1/PfpI family protein [Microlunatus speluncae]